MKKLPILGLLALLIAINLLSIAVRPSPVALIFNGGAAVIIAGLGVFVIVKP